MNQFVDYLELITTNMGIKLECGYGVRQTLLAFGVR